MEIGGVVRSPTPSSGTSAGGTPTERGLPFWSLSAALAGLPLALIAVGPAITIAVRERSLPIYASHIAVCALLLHMGFSILAHKGIRSIPVTARWILAGATLLAIPVLWASDAGAGIVAYLNFASGTVGGIAIGLLWKETARQFSWIDAGFVVFLVLGCLQLLSSFRGAGSIISLHQSSQTPWGNSNFVAGCLVVAAYVVVARAIQVGRFQKIALLFGTGVIAVASLTLSRGAILAAAAGAILLLWLVASRRNAVASSGGQRIIPIFVSRILAVLVPVAAFLAIERVTDLRAQVNRQVFINVDTRFTLYELAWRQFLEHPFTGTGWASFRDASLNAAGQIQTFAHNLVLSMLQIGGLLAMPYLVGLFCLAISALRRGGPYAAAIGAALALSMTDPFFESTVGNLIVIPIIMVAVYADKAASDDFSDRATGGVGAVHGGVRQ